MRFLSILGLLLCSTAFAQNNSKHWIYGGIDLGAGTQKSDDASENDSSNGKYFGGQLLYQYRMAPQFNLEVGAGWLDYKTSNTFNLTPNKRVRLHTQAPYLSTGLYYQTQSPFSFGLIANYVLDDGLLVSAKDESTILAGLGAWYNIPTESVDVRIGANIRRSMDFINREAMLYGVSIQVGFPIKNTTAPKLARNQVQKAPGIVQTVVKQDVTLVTLDKTLINFETNSFDLDMKSKSLILKLGAFLASNPDLYEKVYIEGHTDARGSDYYNNVLSVRRANSVYEELQTVSLPKNRLFFNGAGKSKPLDPSENLEAYAQNRRVDLKFINVTNKAYFNAFIAKLIKEHQR